MMVYVIVALIILLIFGYYIFKDSDLDLDISLLQFRKLKMDIDHYNKMEQKFISMLDEHERRMIVIGRFKVKHEGSLCDSDGSDIHKVSLNDFFGELIDVIYFKL